MILPIISIIVFVTYISFVGLKYGIQKSMSASYYIVKPNILFTLFCWGFSLPFMIYAGPIHPIFFFAGAGICFTGAASDFLGDELTQKVHMASAFSAVILGMIGLVLTGLWWMVGIFVVYGLAVMLFANYKIWWIEVLAFVVILIGVMI
jgi:hypothetical protein